MTVVRLVRGLMHGSLVASVLLPTAAAGQSADPGAAMLRTGDVLRVTAYGLPEMSGELMVGPDGALVHPMYRNVSLVGLPRDTVEQRIGWLLERFEANPRFVIEPLVQFIVGGQVGEPGFHNVPPGTTVRQGVLLAGGTPEDDRDDAITLIRDGTPRPLDLVRSGSVELLSGDEVIVPRVENDGNFFRDVLGPIASVAAVVVGIVNVANR